MSRISGQSSQISQLQNAMKVSLADKNLDKNELKQLKQMLQDTPGLSEETKAGVSQFLDEARSDSKGFFFGLFGRGISNREMGALKGFAKSQGDNPILSGLVQELESHQAQTTHPSRRSQNATQTRGTAPFNAVEQSFPTRPTQQSSQTSASTSTPVSSVRGRAVSSSADFNQFYVTQNGNYLPSSKGDCGPAAGAMIAKRFGFIQNLDNKASVQAARNASGVTHARNGAWAINEAELTRSISGLTGGQVNEVAHQEFHRGDASRVIDMLRQQIDNGAMPVLETGSPYRDTNQGGRHFMVVMGVKDDGTLVLADPGGKRQWEMSPDRLAEEIIQSESNGGSHVLAYND